MHFSLEKCCFWKRGKIEKDFEIIKTHVKMFEKRRDIFHPLGVPLCTLSLQIAAFGREAKAKQTFEK